MERKEEKNAKGATERDLMEAGKRGVSQAFEWVRRQLEEQERRTERRRAERARAWMEERQRSARRAMVAAGVI